MQVTARRTYRDANATAAEDGTPLQSGQRAYVTQRAVHSCVPNECMFCLQFQECNHLYFAFATLICAGSSSALIVRESPVANAMHDYSASDDRETFLNHFHVRLAAKVHGDLKKQQSK